MPIKRGDSIWKDVGLRSGTEIENRYVHIDTRQYTWSPIYTRVRSERAAGHSLLVHRLPRAISPDPLCDIVGSTARDRPTNNSVKPGLARMFWGETP